MKLKKIFILVMTIISLFNSMLYAKEELPKDKPGTAVFVMSNNNIDKIIVDTEFIKERTEHLYIDMNIPVIEGLKNRRFQKKINKSIKKHQLCLKSTIEKDASQNCPVNPYELMTNYHVKSNNDIFSLEISVYDYRGGAHGMSAREYYNIDTKTGKQIYLGEISNIEMINKEVQRQIVERSNKGETFFDEAFKFPGIDKNQSFYIANDGQLVIVFGLYEIAPYSAGILEFPIPKID